MRRISDVIRIGAFIVRRRPSNNRSTSRGIIIYPSEGGTGGVGRVKQRRRCRDRASERAKQTVGAKQNIHRGEASEGRREEWGERSGRRWEQHGHKTFIHSDRTAGKGARSPARNVRAAAARTRCHRWWLGSGVSAHRCVTTATPLEGCCTWSSEASTSTRACDGHTQMHAKETRATKAPSGLRNRCDGSHHITLRKGVAKAEHLVLSSPSHRGRREGAAHPGHSCPAGL